MSQEDEPKHIERQRPLRHEYQSQPSTSGPSTSLRGSIDCLFDRKTLMHWPPLL
jgi:hypothetical protein